jgi:uncharacterized protein (DUF2249 family)
MTTSPLALDVRGASADDRLATLFSTYRSLDFGQTLELMDDQELRPLYDKLRHAYPGDFAWIVLKSGPDAWQVAITKLGMQPWGPCCGHCGGDT